MGLGDKHCGDELGIGAFVLFEDVTGSDSIKFECLLIG